jgi:peptidoglycan hydrolase CwlO-like protein
MTRLHGIIVVLAAALVAVWGCGQSPPQSAAGSKSLETRVAKLEQELKAALDARDAAKAQAADLDRKLKAEQARVGGIEKERDELRLSLKTRTTELDTTTAKFNQLHKGLKELVGQMETTGSPQVPPGSPASVQALPSPNGL